MKIVTDDTTSVNAFNKELSRRSQDTTPDLTPIEKQLITLLLKSVSDPTNQAAYNELRTALQEYVSSDRVLTAANIDEVLSQTGFDIIRRNGPFEFSTPALIQPFNLLVHQKLSNRQLELLRNVRLLNDFDETANVKITCGTFAGLKTILRNSVYTTGSKGEKRSPSTEIIDCYLANLEKRFNERENTEGRKIKILGLSTFEDEIIGGQQRTQNFDNEIVVVFFDGSVVND